MAQYPSGDTADPIDSVICDPTCPSPLDQAMKQFRSDGSRTNIGMPASVVFITGSGFA